MLHGFCFEDNLIPVMEGFSWVSSEYRKFLSLVKVTGVTFWKNCHLLFSAGTEFSRGHLYKHLPLTFYEDFLAFMVSKNIFFINLELCYCFVYI